MNGAESRAPTTDDGSAELAYPAPPLRLRRTARVAYKSLLWLFLLLVAVVLVVSFLPGIVGVFLIEIPFTLAFGWIGFLFDITESAEVNYGLLIEGAVVVAALAVGGHYFARWLYGALQPSAHGPWRTRWTAGGLALVLLLFVAGIATIGLSHQTAWLFMRTDPIIWNSFATRVKVQEGVNLANAHRTALAIECSEGTLTPGSGNEQMDLAAPADYNDGRRVYAVTARVIDEHTATVTIVYYEIRPDITDGATVVFTGICDNGTMTWSVGGTVTKRHLPRI